MTLFFMAIGVGTDIFVFIFWELFRLFKSIGGLAGQNAIKNNEILGGQGMR